MSAHTPCPDSQRLEGLLRDGLPDGEQVALTEHVGDCVACQGALDRLAAGPSADALRQAERERPAADSAYWAAVQALDNDLTQIADGGHPGTPEVVLDFLAPADDPSHL